MLPAVKFHLIAEFIVCSVVGLLLAHFGDVLCETIDCVVADAVYWVMGAFALYHLGLLLAAPILALFGLQEVFFRQMLLLKSGILALLIIYFILFTNIHIFVALESMYLIFASLFLVLQVWLIVDASNRIAEAVFLWSTQGESSNNRVNLILFAIFLVYLGCAVALFMTIYMLSHTSQIVRTNTFIVLALAFAIMCNTFTTVTASVQEAHQHKLGLVQASLISAFSIFLLLLAISSQPDNLVQCNPFGIPQDPLSLVLFCAGVLFAAVLLFFALARTDVETEDEYQQILTMILAHSLFFLAAFYVTELLTNWAVFLTGSAVLCLQYSLTSFWIKVSLAFGTHLLFFVYALAPLATF